MQRLSDTVLGQSLRHQLQDLLHRPAEHRIICLLAFYHLF